MKYKRVICMRTTYSQYCRSKLFVSQTQNEIQSLEIDFGFQYVRITFFFLFRRRLFLGNRILMQHFKNQTVGLPGLVVMAPKSRRRVDVLREPQELTYNIRVLERERKLVELDYICIRTYRIR